MGKRTRYEPGTFSWVDLATTEAAAAKAFYGDLFGWEAHDMPAGEAGTYTMLRLDGDDVCALYEQSAEMRERGVAALALLSDRRERRRHGREGRGARREGPRRGPSTS